MRLHGPEQITPLKYAAVAMGIGAITVSLVVGLRASTPENHAEPESSSQTAESEKHESYPVHRDITATIFWVGEAADESNRFIHNSSSAWVEDWVGAYGGVDDPTKRCDHLPCDFAPKENPFYFALPYNDFDDNGTRKESAKDIPWYTGAFPSESQSIVKNRWVEVTLNDAVAYAQWEDAGPFEYDDVDYVFGDGRPKAPAAGLDLSPATASWLKMDGRDQVNWRFVEETDVLDGPWRTTVTRSD